MTNVLTTQKQNSINRFQTFFSLDVPGTHEEPPQWDTRLWKKAAVGLAAGFALLNSVQYAECAPPEQEPVEEPADSVDWGTYLTRGVQQDHRKFLKQCYWKIRPNDRMQDKGQNYAVMCKGCGKALHLKQK